MVYYNLAPTSRPCSLYVKARILSSENGLLSLSTPELISIVCICSSSVFLHFSTSSFVHATIDILCNTLMLSSPSHYVLTSIDRIASRCKERHEVSVQFEILSRTKDPYLRSARTWTAEMGTMNVTQPIARTMSIRSTNMGPQKLSRVRSMLKVHLPSMALSIPTV